MKEEFLHYVWQYKLFSSELVTTGNEKIKILKNGSLNKNSGPDFLNAQLEIDNQIWVGNVEIHLKSSDWYVHQHETDVNYDAVILHVVYEDDTQVFMKNNTPLPTLELKDKIDKGLLNDYQNLFSTQLRWIPCEGQIAEVDKFLLSNWLERLYFERLENKSIVIKQLLEQSNNDFEVVLFQLLAKNFGLKVNADAFLSLAQSLDFSIIKKERFKEKSLTSLLFGQAGFLEDNLESEFHYQLKKEYAYLKHKYNLQSLANSQFQFFRMRPNNFPTIRIAQLVSLYHQYQNLFSKLMEIKKAEDFYLLFAVEVNEFWKSHYTFEKESKKSPKKLTKPFIDLLIINTIIPLKFVYEQSRGEVDETQILKLIKQLKPEKNSTISKFADFKIKANNAFETQALLELKSNYCTPKHCLQCGIGNSLLRKNDTMNKLLKRD
ncbi:uncharacterized protein DUF2851 [Tenacibaculum adriaticum]|uniref:Uncharacterized protein DUF2851 n=1 Tax=Tenacibaculum adriaticum TaxID=413713 RepID=A0A5S5DNL7_9FLAO|nr:DUF2851 family protein [Tenacibaculum adriaticum]TYP97507.1 uncharacterized protein DUF2851 [Tenacibaculum adriaticum]